MIAFEETGRICKRKIGPRRAGSLSFPQVLGHDHHPGEVHAYAARLAPNLADKDELALAHAKKYKVTASEIFHLFAAWADEADTARDEATVSRREPPVLFTGDSSRRETWRPWFSE